MASLQKQPSKLWCKWKSSAYSARLAPFFFEYVNLEVEGDRAYGSLILLSGGEGVEMPVLSRHGTGVPGDLWCHARTELPRNLTDQDELLFYFYFFLSEYAKNSPKLS